MAKDICANFIRFSCRAEYAVCEQRCDGMLVVRATNPSNESDPILCHNDGFSCHVRMISAGRFFIRFAWWFLFAQAVRWAPKGGGWGAELMTAAYFNILGPCAWNHSTQVTDPPRSGCGDPTESEDSEALKIVKGLQGLKVLKYGF